ncbi:MAG: dephospho-CoA kinase [Gemmatimonadales bacterium]|nr:dephospho-CoA kinase [Gemmatimonadales bacterium]
MIKVGLTGNVAAGKSVVLDLLRRLGATVIDADALVREVEQPGTAVLRRIAERFGPDALRSDGALDRSKLRRRVMGDPAALSDLNAIVHPAVELLHRERIAQAERRGDPIVVSDVPLLFEVGWEDEFDLIILVDAPEEIRRRRLVTLRQFTPEEADELLASQHPAEGKRQRSDIVIENVGSVQALEARVREVWKTLVNQAPAEGA